MANIKTKDQIAFGSTVRKVRNELDLSQEDLALEAHMDRTYVSGIERGTRNISLLNLIKLAKGLHLKAFELLRRAGL
jgi:transcriptional regulator with XRE-family HTH domain